MPDRPYTRSEWVLVLATFAAVMIGCYFTYQRNANLPDPVQLASHGGNP